MAIDTIRTEGREPFVDSVCRSNIWEFKQNRGDLVVEGIAEAKDGLSDDDIRIVLMARGVNKAFATRRKLIWMKQRVKAEITRRAERASSLGPRERAKNAGALEALNCVLRSIRCITHGPRWTEVE